jgi:hypothetical protein
MTRLLNVREILSIEKRIDLLELDISQGTESLGDWQTVQFLKGVLEYDRRLRNFINKGFKVLKGGKAA